MRVLKMALSMAKRAFGEITLLNGDNSLDALLRETSQGTAM